ADGYEGVAAAQEPDGLASIRAAPFPVVAIALLEVAQVEGGVRELLTASPKTSEGEPDEIGARQLLRIVECKVGEKWHPVILELARPHAGPVIEWVAGDGRRRVPQVGRRPGGTVLAHVSKISPAPIVARGAGGRARRAQPLDPPRAVARTAIAVPESRIGASEAKQ